ncbi:hypothetical protein HPB50_026130 [Hyalomma asiaticum]|uniref:Uncharacterized protein n=1 Tax=Hyalomma asiaticum TaxID=266040 RepID=A0ACB7S9H9_HYAAI|nr:hypothetical protein HPB50_026130 [Hyalomma asiaticum]
MVMGEVRSGFEFAGAPLSAVPAHAATAMHAQRYIVPRILSHASYSYRSSTQHDSSLSVYTEDEPFQEHQIGCPREGERENERGATPSGAPRYTTIAQSLVNDKADKLEREAGRTITEDSGLRVTNLSQIKSFAMSFLGSK